MNLFSYIFIIIAIWIVYSCQSNKDRFNKFLVLNIAASLFLESGYFVKIMNKEVDYNEACQIITFIFAVMIIFPKVSKKIFCRGMFLVGSVLVGVLGIILHPYGKLIVTGDSINYDSVLNGSTSLNYIRINAGVILSLVYLLMFVIIAMAVWKSYLREDYKLLVRRVGNLSKAYIVVGVVEIIIAYIFHSNIFRYLVNFVFGKGISTFLGLVERGDGYMLQGFNREGSHYCYALFSIGLFLAAQRVNGNKKNTIWFLGLGIIFVFCNAFSAILYVLALLVYYMLFVIYKSKNRKQILNKILLISMSLVLVVSVAVAVIFYTAQDSDLYIVQRIYNLMEVCKILIQNYNISSLGTISSNAIRIYSIISTLALYLDRPLFGFGIGTMICHGSSVMFLADIGLVGMISWWRFVVSDYKVNDGTKADSSFYAISMFVYVLVNCFSSRYLIPFYGVAVIAINVALKVIFGKIRVDKRIVEKSNTMQ